MKFDPREIVLSCEHAGQAVPAYAKPFFSAPKLIMGTHRAYDWGALPVTKRLGLEFGLKAHLGRFTRLVVDLNRSPYHGHLYSKYIHSAPSAVKQRLIDTYYLPHRLGVERDIEAAIRKYGRAIHIAIHSFTPTLRGEVRNADLGVLYDPRRKPEVSWSNAFIQAISPLEPSLRIRKNYPYRGASDCLGSYLRKRFSAQKYISIEIEWNHQYLTENGVGKIASMMIAALRGMA